MNNSSHNFATQIKAKMGKYQPQTAIILGSGLGSLGDSITNHIFIPYQDIEGFPTSTVAGHQGRFIVGQLEGKEVLCMQGRFHLYEGYLPSIIADVIKTFKLLGIKNLIVTNAAGSLREQVGPGSLMLINDHINLSGFNPLIGPNDEKFGPRFPPMHSIYTPAFRTLAHQIADRLKLKLHDGVYLMVSGPNFETAAEIRAFQTLGGDAVGMSTVPETMVAAYCGLNVLGISAITNYCTGIKGGAPNHTETLENGKKATQNLTYLVREFLKEL